MFKQRICTVPMKLALLWATHNHDASLRLFVIPQTEMEDYSLQTFQNCVRLRKGRTLQDGSREFATAICCVCADRTFLDSAIIFKAQDSWFTDMAGVPENFLLVACASWKRTAWWAELSLWLGTSTLEPTYKNPPGHPRLNSTTTHK